MFGRRGHAFADLASGLLGAAFFILIVWGCFEPALHSWVSNEFEGEGALRVPVWPARFVVMFGAALVVAIYLGQVAARAPCDASSRARSASPNRRRIDGNARCSVTAK